MLGIVCHNAIMFYNKEKRKVIYEYNKEKEPVRGFDLREDG